MTENKADKSILDFLRDQTSALEVRGDDFSISDMVTPSRRSWETASRLVKTNLSEIVNNEVFIEVLGGIVAPTNAVAYSRFLETYAKTFKLDDILNSYDKIKLSYDFSRTDVITTHADEMLALVKTNIGSLDNSKFANFFAFLADIPKDFSYSFFDNLIKATKTIDNEEKSIWMDDEIVKAFDFNKNTKAYKILKDNFSGLFKPELDK